MFIFHFLFLSPQDLRAPSANRRKTLPHDLYVTQFYNSSPKIRGSSPKNFWANNMQNLGRFYTTFDFDREYLRNETRYPKSERLLIETDFCRVRRNKSDELWSTIQKVRHVSLDPTKSTFFARPYFSP